MRTTAALTIVCLGICLGLGLDASRSRARAIDLVLQSQAGQSVEFNDNRDLAPKSKGDTYTFLSTLMFDAVVRTPTTKFAATVDLSYQAFTGPGADQLLNALNHGVRASMETKERLNTYNLAGSTPPQFRSRTSALPLSVAMSISMWPKAVRGGS